jgi:hypothetical protein
MYYEYGKHHMVDAAMLLEQVARLSRLDFCEREMILEGYNFLCSVIVADEQKRSASIH